MGSETSATRSGGRRRWAVRSLASLLAALLVFAGVVPSFALAEKETEGEGTSPPGALPGLEVGLGGELAGEETSLEEVAVEAGEAESKEGASDAEAELPEPAPSMPPAAAEEAVPPPAEAPAAPAAEAPPPAAESVPVAPTPSSAAPAYGPASSAPSYEPSAPPVPSNEVVQNESITAPEASPTTPKPSPGRSSSEAPEAEPESTIEPMPSEPAPAPATTVVAAPPGAALNRPGSLVGKRSHTVISGECLWTIAAAVLPPGASVGEIAAEVHRLWRLNATRIGTGDPNLLPVGVQLRLL